MKGLGEGGLGTAPTAAEALTGSKTNTNNSPNAGGAQSAMLAAALRYAARGWYVFPAPPGTKRSFKSKKYSGSNWGATVDPAEIKRNWKRWPNANIGVATGEESGIFLLDADTAAGHGVDGLASLRELEAKHGALPLTLMARTPSGGEHRVFRHPGNGIKIKNSASEIAAGIDVRGTGGMFIAPPSAKGDAAYDWLNDAPIAVAPQWLLDLVVDHRPQAAGSRPPASPTRHVYVPDPDPEFEAEVRARSGLGVDQTTSYAASREELQAALDVIPSDNYHVWFKVGCALYRELGDAGYDIYAAWSGKSPKYDPRKCAQQWKNCQQVSGYTAATIFYYAVHNDADWQNRLMRW